MNLHAPPVRTERDPISALVANGDAAPAALCIITRTEGPSYRPVGAVMAIIGDGVRIGTLSSGCIERDLTLHAGRALAKGAPVTVLYGRGSPYIDIDLPCGGGLEILVVPAPDVEVLTALASRRANRQPATLVIDRETGALRLSETGETGWSPDNRTFVVRFVPELRFLIFGKGPEAATLAAMVQAAGYPNQLLSPDVETLEIGAGAGCKTTHLTKPAIPASGTDTDLWTAIVLFFHDHDWEPPILVDALKTRAFYIGAQGSQRARDARLAALEAMGVSYDARARLHGPIGLVPSARDARTLAVSVFAEVLGVAKQRGVQGP